MRMILEEKSYRIRKITKDDGCLCLYPKGSKKALKIGANLVDKDFSPKKKWPWQTYELKVKVVANKCIVFAELDGKVLFDIPEDKYPEDIKKEIRRVEKIESDYAEFQKEYTDSINAQLHDFLPKVPKVADLEDEINKLPVCWRAYFKPRLLLQYDSDDAQQRLFLMYHLGPAVSSTY